MMIFNSIIFVEFLLCLLILICILRKVTSKVEAENLLLLVASYYFYGSFNIAFLLCLVYVTAVNYVGGIVLEKKRNKAVLSMVLLLSLLPLVTFKYAEFLLSDILGWVESGFFVGWVVPLGISFFTFQALSYSIDLYRGKIFAEKNLFGFSLFVAFFPTILSGPIERGRNLLPQLKVKRNISWEKFNSATCVFSYGLFKKIVIADRLSAYIDMVYSNPTSHSSVTLAFTALLYSVQIYCDFSGYSDMAVGVARAIGFNITQNFRFPYFAKTIKDFWHCWHISLTSWFTEYVYFSLGGNRVKYKVQWAFNISLIFLLSGIWHGAAWGFIIWGTLHAVLYLVEHFLGCQAKDFNPSKLFTAFYAPLVFFVVTLAWIFFRAESLDLAWQIISGIFTNGGTMLVKGASTMTFACNMALCLIFVVAEILLCCKKEVIIKPVMKICALIGVWLMLCLFSTDSDSFVYFQF